MMTNNGDNNDLKKKKSNKKNKKKKDKSKKDNITSTRGMDTMLKINGKNLNCGDCIRFTLIKGPRINNQLVPDPVNSKAPHECFPLIAKFSESVIRPDFTSHQWKSGRLYQQDVPKAQIESDEEEDEAKAIESRKRWKRSRKIDPPKRQWILQEEVDFLETMMNKRQQQKQTKTNHTKSDNDANSSNMKNKLSSRYEGIPEHNPSHYTLMHAKNSDNNVSTIQVTLLPNPPNVMVNFAQPMARKTLTMSEAEMAIQDQRANMTRYMMHNQKGNTTFLAQQALANQRNKISKSKARLMGKVHSKASAENEDEENDDVMADVAFRERKGGSRARKELLTSLGNENIKVDDDGVLGGNNDDEFGGKRHFGRLKVPSKSNSKNNDDDEGGGSGNKGDAGNSDKNKGNAGMAMDEGFYHRDVKAEYEELDYDVNEQFDDDDVDVGETEVFVDSGGFAQDNDDDDDDVEEDADMGNDNVSGAEGLASVAGFKAMLAKARGENVGDNNNNNTDGENTGTDGNADNDKNKEDNGKTKNGGQKVSEPTKPQNQLQKIMEADKKRSRQDSGNDDKANGGKKKRKKKDENDKTVGRASLSASAGNSGGNDLDDNGDQILSLESVRKEIWLNRGEIQMKRLMKLFKVNKKTTRERQHKFRDVVKELCNMREDPIAGRLLFLKQHYSN